MSEPLLRLVNVSKSFGGVRAVQHVSLDVPEGEVVGLVGDNGAGKSTLIKLISGVYVPEEGEIYFGGRRVALKAPKDALDLGIQTIYQDLALVENLDVGANVFLGREPLRRYLGLVPVFDDRKIAAEAEHALDRLAIHIPSLQNPVRDLSGGQRQSVAIARAVYWNARLMIMDEPTAALGVAEHHKVLDLILVLKGQGIPVILVSHTLPDIFAVTDRIVVMRRGVKVRELPTKGTTSDEVVKFIVGADVAS
jgi:ABC-type sugar transport system ATPase subunit